MTYQKQPIYDYYGKYEVDTDGVIWSLKSSNRKALKPSKTQTVILSKNNIKKAHTVSRLVAEAFVPNPKPKRYTIVRHYDNDVTNNHADNLYWSTRYKVQHEISKGTRRLNVTNEDLKILADLNVDNINQPAQQAVLKKLKQKSKKLLVHPRRG